MHRWIRNPKAPSSLWDGLVLDGAYAGLHPGTNRFVDGSGLENHGTLTNMDAATDWVWSDELQRYTVSSSGGTRIVSFGTELAGVGDLTFSAWVYVSAVPNFSRIVTNERFMLYQLTDNNVLWLTNDGSSTIFYTENFTKQAWIAVCVTRRGTTLAISLNGVQTASGSGGTPVAGSTALTLANRTALNRGFVGQIADATLRNRPLAHAEITWLSDRSNRLYVPDTRRAIWVPTPFNPALMRRRRRMAGAR